MRILITFFFFSILSLTAATKAPLTLSDIRPRLEKISKEHVTKKKINKKFFQEALNIYIEQFDPLAVYLLEKDIAPYMSLSEQQLEKIYQEFLADNFSVFEKLNTTIQNAIKKMRAFRRSIVVSQERFEEAAEKPLRKQAFVSDPKHLLERHFIFFSKEIQSQKSASFLENVRRAELEIEEEENNYLFSDEDQEALFSFNIMRALTKALDTHTSYLDKKEAENLRQKLEKSYVGAGIIVDELAKSFIVESIIKGSSADTSGVIRPGDELVRIDGKSISNMNLDEVESLLDGEINTNVSLYLERRSSYRGERIPIRITLQRREVEILEGRVDTSYETFADGIIGTIKLHAFYEGSKKVNSTEDMRKAIRDLKKKGPLKGIVLDLRDNRGGFLLQAVKVCGLFIKTGVVVSAKYANGDIIHFRDLDKGLEYSGPLVVLISKKTASAAEIVAQGLKEYGVAVICGDEKSFGKGSIQLQTVTKGTSDDSYFKVTVGRYYGVSGKSTQIDGVKSDIVIPGYYSRKRLGEEYMNGAIEKDSIGSSFEDRLEDVPFLQKGWFKKYYIPFLQPKVTKYRKYIPELQKQSSERIKNNDNYLRLINGQHIIYEKIGFFDQKVVLDEEAYKETFSQYQLQETKNVLKDLIQESAG